MGVFLSLCIQGRLANHRAQQVYTLLPSRLWAQMEQKSLNKFLSIQELHPTFLVDSPSALTT